MSATIRTSGLPADFKPAPQSQAVADEIQVHFGFTSFGTYKGHEPTAELGLDIFVTKADGDRLAPWLVENIERLGIDYVIWWQRIYNPEIATHWRDMPDRGSDTANHKDHVHVSLEASAPPDQGDDMTPEQAEKLQKVLEVVEGLKTEDAKHQHTFETWDQVILGLDSSAAVDVDKLAAALSDRLGADVAKALGAKLSA